MTRTNTLEVLYYYTTFSVLDVNTVKYKKIYISHLSSVYIDLPLDGLLNLLQLVRGQRNITAGQCGWCR